MAQGIVILASIAFFGSLLLGQLGGLIVAPGVVVYVHDIILVGVLILFGMRKITTNPKSSFRLGLPILVFIGSGVLSLLGNWTRFPKGEILVSALYLVRWASYAGLYFIVQWDLMPSFWLDGLFWVGTGFGLVGFAQYFLYPDLRNLSYLGWDPHYYRLFSTLLDPNFVGIILVLTLFLGLRRLEAARTIKNGLLFVCALVALILTYSRGSYLAFVTGFLFWSAVRRQWTYGLVLLVIFAIGIVSAPLRNLEILRIDRRETALARVGNWRETIGLIIRSPLIGHGFNTLRYITPTPQIKTDMPLSRAGAGVDSSVLFVGASIGFIGLVSFGLLAWQAVGIARLLLSRKQTKSIGGAVAGSMVALFVHSMFANSLFYPWVMVWFWILMGSAERMIIFGRKRGAQFSSRYHLGS